MASSDTWSTMTNAGSSKSSSPQFNSSTKTKSKEKTKSNFHSAGPPSDETPSQQSTAEQDYSSQRISDYLQDTTSTNPEYDDRNANAHAAEMKSKIEDFDAFWSQSSH